MTLFIAVFVLTVSCLCQGCENVLPKLYVNEGTDVQIKFTLSDVSTTGVVAVSVRQNSTFTIINITYINGKIYIDDGAQDVVFNGDATHGKIWFIIYHIGHDRAGVFELIRISFGVLECQTVYILGKPTVWLSKNGEDAALGGNAIFSCHGTSTTAPTDHGLNLIYLWTFEGVPANDSRFTLSANNMTVTSVTKFDQNKTVSCKVTENVEGGLTSDKSNQEIINVNFGPENISLNPSTTTYTNEIGTEFIDIVCTAICNPLCTYVWTKDGRYLAGQSGNTLSLGYLDRSKAGIYTCTATRSSYSLTKDITVHVIYGPHEVLITPPHNNYTYNEGHLLNNILCSSECYPSCIYKWTKRLGSFSVDNETLSLGILTRQKRGVYICNATNTSTQLQRSSQITVNVRYGPDEIILVPTSISHTVVEGDALQTIKCSAKECWPECAQAWTNVTSGKLIGTGGTLSLGTSSRYFTGEYKCTSTNISPEVQKKTDKSVFVTVSYFPVVKFVNETSIEVTEHNVNISLLCLARGVPDRYTFFPWVQKAPDLETPVQEYKGVSMGNRNRLVLKHLSYMNSGLYICSVTNNITNYETGKSLATKTLRVKVQGKPFVTESESIVDGTTGTHVKVNVSFFSNDDTKPFVTWFKIVNDTRSQLNISSDGKFREMSSDETVLVRYFDVFVNQKGKKSQLEITNIGKDDFGYYEIEIVNSIGSLIYRLELVPRGPPSLPMNFTVVYSSETTTSITLIWLPGFHGGANQTFHIEYKTNSTQWAKGLAISGGKRSDLANATVSDLLPGTEYMFQLYSENIYGRKNVSIFTTGTTSEVKSDAESTSASSLNVGATAGAAITAVLIATVTIAAVIFLLRRYKRLRVSRNEQKRDVVMGFINGNEYVNMNAQTGDKVCKAGSEETGEAMRLPEHLYESLNRDRKSSSTYEKLTTANQCDTQRSAASEYDVLDSETTNKHIYTGLEVEATAKSCKKEMTKQRMNDNTRRMQSKDDIDKASEQNLGQKAAEPEAVYSNLMLRNA